MKEFLMSAPPLRMWIQVATAVACCCLTACLIFSCTSASEAERAARKLAEAHEGARLVKGLGDNYMVRIPLDGMTSLIEVTVFRIPDSDPSASTDDQPELRIHMNRAAETGSDGERGRSIAVFAVGSIQYTASGYSATPEDAAALKDAFATIYDQVLATRSP